MKSEPPCSTTIVLCIMLPMARTEVTCHVALPMMISVGSLSRQDMREDIITLTQAL